MIARLAFAIATNIDPDILVIDEVLAVGDELFQRKCYAKIEKFMKAGVSILFVSHNAETINHLCTRAALIEKGELILDGPPKLVTSQYHRLLYANPEDTLKVRDEIGRLNQNEVLKSEVLEEINKKAYPGKEINDFQRKQTIEVKKPNKTRQKAYYVPQLKPKSTVEYKSCDVEISKIHIKTLDGEIVNILVLNEEYIYSCKIKFNIDTQNVSFGMRIKSDKGLHISGAATHRINVFIDKVLNGEEYEVSCWFKCLLLPGTYFTNIGVARILNDKTVFLNRIVDASVFKVQPVPNNLYAGLVNLDQKMTITKINSSIK
jgi:lipopolysaccharide transport system ATP-binding protein